MVWTPYSMNWFLHGRRDPPVLTGQSQRELHLQGSCETEFVHPQWSPKVDKTWILRALVLLWTLAKFYRTGLVSWWVFLWVQCPSRLPRTANAFRVRLEPGIFSWRVVWPLTLTMAWWYSTWSLTHLLRQLPEVTCPMVFGFCRNVKRGFCHLHGGVLKWGYLQIMHFLDRSFHCKPSILFQLLGYPHFRKPSYGSRWLESHPSDAEIWGWSILLL